jgi:hypothetical protein
VEKELLQHSGTLQSLRSHTPASMLGELLTIAPQRTCSFHLEVSQCLAPSSNVQVVWRCGGGIGRAVILNVSWRLQSKRREGY